MPEDYGKPEFNPDFFKAQPFEFTLGGHLFMHTTLKDTIDLIDRVIYHDPATIIYWKDYTKTVVKCADGFEYDEVIGFLMCILRKTLNGRQYTKLCDAMAEPYAIRKRRENLIKETYGPSITIKSDWWNEKTCNCGENCSCKK